MTDQRLQAERARHLHQLAVEMVIRQNVILKSARIYEPNNLIFSRQIGLLHSLIQTALADFGEAYLTARGSTLFFNNLRLKFGYANYHFFKFVLEEYRKKEIGGLRFEPGVTEDDLKRLALAMVKGADGKPPGSYEALAEEVERQGISAKVVLEKMLASDLDKSQEKYAAKVFFLGVAHLEEAFESEHGEEKIKLSTTRRLMQSVFNHIVDNESFSQGLTNIKNFHEYTLNHSMNVCILSIALGRRLGLDRNELIDLGLSAFFHDLGKLDTPKDVLEKPGKLDDKERAIIEKHPHQGAGRLIHSRDFRGLPLRAIHVALEHHVKEDLTGYPQPYKKHAVNLFSKIVKITDYFDAITTKRVYRTSQFTRDDALNLMLAQSGREFHPVLLREFVKMMGVYPVGSLVALDTGEVAVVVENNPETPFLLRPKAKIVAAAGGGRVDGDEVDLSESKPETRAFVRTIVKTLDPEKYGVRVADYFLARVE
jgi:HD-GYP domain-containing protein (c-di-GMP phosphodiesterase class II)